MGTAEPIAGDLLSMMLPWSLPEPQRGVGMRHALLISARADGSFDTHYITRRFSLFAPPCC